MQKYPIVEEVRTIRHEIEWECQEDPDRLFEYFQDSQGKLGDRLVRRRPKPIELLPLKEKSS